MATLNAVFKIFDGYSSPIDKINRKTDDATTKMLKASGATDSFNTKLAATGASANTASSGLGKMVAIMAVIATLKKGMEITDEYTNTSARLNLINDGLQTQVELQDKIFAAADRSRGAYSDMADAISKMGLLAGDAFGSNDELIAFTELTQKSFKVSGTDTSTQQAAMRQLTQAMASGRLQGDEFVSIQEGAPLISKAIEKYMKTVVKAEGTMKDWSSQGLLTTQVIKNAVFAMSDEINEKAEGMPITFADVWNRIMNGALKAFAPIIENVNGLINSDGFINLVNNIIGGINLLAGTISYVCGLVIEYWPEIKAILIAIGAFILINVIGYLSAAIPVLISFISLWVAANAPMITIVATLALIMYALGEAGVTARDVFGVMGGNINVVIQFFKNLGLTVANIALGIGGAIGALGINIEAAFHNAISSVQSWWYDMLSTALTVVGEIAAALNELPFVEFDYSGITSAADDFAAKSAEAAGDKKEYTSISDAFEKGNNTFDTFEAGWDDKAYKSGYDAGNNLYDGISDKLKDLTDSLTDDKDKDKDKGFNPDDYKTDPITVKGTGKNDGVKVDMSDEDLQYLRDIAERDYINKFSTATLAPNISVTFGDVHEEADMTKVEKRIVKILQEEIAMTAEGG